MKIIKSQTFEKHQTRRFRASIYFDIFVPATEDKEADRQVANQIAEQAARHLSKSDSVVSNPYVGGVAALHGMTLDKEI